MASLNKWSEAAATATVQLQEKYVLYSCKPGPFDHIPRKNVCGGKNRWNKNTRSKHVGIKRKKIWRSSFNIYVVVFAYLL